MLQPENYPKMLGQALVLEPDPFVEMVDDDNPWVEGLFLTVVVGLCIAIAQMVGGLLYSASLPDPAAMLEALVRSAEQMVPGGAGSENLVDVESSLRRWWPLLTALLSHGSGWGRLLYLVLTPLSLMVQWAAYGLLCHLCARALGGVGSLPQTLGVVALAIAPRLLLLSTLLPFVAVSGLLITVWGLLVAYRGLEIAHDFGPGRAAASALLPLLVLFLLGTLGGLVLLWLAGMGGIWMGGLP